MAIYFGFIPWLYTVAVYYGSAQQVRYPLLALLSPLLALYPLLACW